MPVLVLLILIIAAIFGPGLWVRRVLAKYSSPQDRYSGSGAELARHLLDKYGLHDITVEETTQGDHYDPEKKAVRLSPDKFTGHSLTAITVAAHEVGHALQDNEGYPPLRVRSHLVNASRKVERLGAAILLISPFIGLLTRVPAMGLLMFAAGFITLGSTVLVHLVTLPTEFDASFNRALPMLEQNNVLIQSDKRHARRLLQAAAMTYVAASMMSLLNIARWWAILRR